MAKTESEILLSYPKDGLHGRRMIFTNYREITQDNVIKVVQSALSYHLMNVAQIDYLYNYFRGKQDIRLKTKLVRESINNVVCTNHANEIVTFKTAYLLGEPIQYISVGNESQKSDEINLLNDYMRAESKESLDKELADWMHICGVGVRMVLPNDDEVPFSLYTLDPREAFCIYYSGLGHKCLAGVIVQRDEENKEYYCVYTDRFYCEIQGDTFRQLKATDMFPEGGTIRPHIMGGIPVIEYWDNPARMGAFECVIPLLNSINRLESDRVDAVQDFVNAYDVFENCEITEETYKTLTQGGQAINVSSGVNGVPAKVYRISSELNQTGTQTAIDDMKTDILTICGMPSLGDGSGGTSDNVGAVIYRQGYWAAEARAKNTETAWVRSEKVFLKLVLNICTNLTLRVSDITSAFLRNNYSDLQSKAQVLCELLASDKVDPKFAYEASGLFKDAEMAYKAGMSWYEKNLEDLKKRITEEEVDNKENEVIDNATDGGMNE